MNEPFPPLSGGGRDWHPDDWIQSPDGTWTQAASSDEVPEDSDDE